MEKLLRVLLISLLLHLPTLSAQEEESADSAESQKSGKELTEWTNTTQHSATIGGQSVDYEATAGTLLLKEEDGTPRAEIFFIAYTKTGVEDASERPVTFTFNGGPGSSSVWLHLGGVGPKRVLMDEDGFMLPPPGGLADNPYSWLDLSDLVFIDPVSTGFSRAPDEEKAEDFHGVREDVESVGEFIRLWCVRYGRWNSPKFLAGESYGTTRAAGLSSYLQQQHGMYLNGIVLVSSILNFQTVDSATTFLTCSTSPPIPLPPGITSSFPPSCRAFRCARRWTAQRNSHWATMLRPCCKATACLKTTAATLPRGWRL